MLYSLFKNKNMITDSIDTMELLSNCFDFISGIFQTSTTIFPSSFDNFSKDEKDMILSDIIINTHIHHTWNITKPCSFGTFIKDSEMNRSYLSKKLSEEKFRNQHPYAYILEVNANPNKRLIGFRPCFKEFQYALISTRKHSLLEFDIDSIGDISPETDIYNSEIDDALTSTNKALNKRIITNDNDIKNNLASELLQYMHSSNNTITDITNKLLSYSKTLTKYSALLNPDDVTHQNNVALLYLSERLFAIELNNQIAHSPKLIPLFNIINQLETAMSEIENTYEFKTYSYYDNIFSSYNECKYKYTELITTLANIYNSRLIFYRPSLINKIIDYCFDEEFTIDDFSSLQNDLDTINEYIIPFTGELFYATLEQSIHSGHDYSADFFDKYIENNNRIVSRLINLQKIYNPVNLKEMMNSFNTANNSIFEQLYNDISYYKEHNFISNQSDTYELIIAGLSYRYMTQK